MCLKMGLIGALTKSYFGGRITPTKNGPQSGCHMGAIITLTYSLQFESDKMNDWMLEAKLEPEKWANRIETALKLVPKMYRPLKPRKW